MVNSCGFELSNVLIESVRLICDTKDVEDGLLLCC